VTFQGPIPFRPAEFQANLTRLRNGGNSDPYTVWTLAEQIEANRVAIEELRRERDAELQQRREMQAAYDKAVGEDPVAFQKVSEK
jgi:hypothetical protein